MTLKRGAERAKELHVHLAMGKSGGYKVMSPCQCSASRRSGRSAWTVSSRCWSWRFTCPCIGQKLILECTQEEEALKDRLDEEAKKRQELLFQKQASKVSGFRSAR